MSGRRAQYPDKALVHPTPHEPIDAALHDLKKRLERSSVPYELAKHASFLPKRIRRQKKSDRARKRREAAA